MARSRAWATGRDPLAYTVKLGLVAIALATAVGWVVIHL